MVDQLISAAVDGLQHGTQPASPAFVAPFRRMRSILVRTTALSLIALGAAAAPAWAGSICRDDGTGDNNSALASGTNATACGFNALAASNRTTAIGEFVTAFGSNSTAVGERAGAGGGLYDQFGLLINVFANPNSTALEIGRAHV